MKNLSLWIALLAFSILACNRSEIDPVPIEEPPVIQDIISIRVGVAPVSDTEVQLHVTNDYAPRAFEKVRLEYLGQALDSSFFSLENGLFETLLDFPFEANRGYGLVFFTQEFLDTVYRYRIEDYRHQFISNFHYEKLIDIQTLTDFDLSPSRNSLFFSDYVNNIFVLKKVDLRNDELTTIDENFENGNLIRAISDEEILYHSNKWEGRSLQNDTMALIRFKTTNGERSLIGFGWDRFRGYSRIFDGQMFIPNKQFSANTYSLFNLNTGEKTPLEGNQSFPWTGYFNHIYLGNQIFDFENRQFYNPQGIPEESVLQYYDEERELSLSLIFNTYDNQGGFESKIQIFKRNELLFEDEYQRGRFAYFPRLAKFENDKVLLYQDFEFSPQIRYRGYYEIDLTTRSIHLIQHDGSFFNKYDFQLGDRLLSVRNDGIYSLESR